MADETSDVEMLVVTEEELTREEAFARSGLPSPQTWKSKATPGHLVFGYVDGVPVEQIWWSRAHAESQIAAYDSAEAIANGVSLRSTGLLERWQAHLAEYPEELARQRIEEAAATWAAMRLRRSAQCCARESGLPACSGWSATRSGSCRSSSRSTGSGSRR